MFSSYKNSALQHHLFFIKSGCRYLYSLWFNFRHFPWEIAKNLPIVFFKGAYAEISGQGKIVLTDSFIEGNKHVMVGSEVKDFDYQCEKTYLHVEGTLTFDGYVNIRRGAMIDVCGNMSFGNDCRVSSRARIRAYNSITIGKTVRIAHESQIFDTNFHYSENIHNPQYNPCSSPIRIGSYCWIGNRTTISKGTILPDHTTVASNSLVARDYSDLPPYSVIGGMPAKLLKSDFTRVWDKKREDEYMKREFEWYRLKQGE